MKTINLFIALAFLSLTFSNCRRPAQKSTAATAATEENTTEIKKSNPIAEVLRLDNINIEPTALDSSSLQSYLDNTKLTSSEKNDIKSFYTRRNLQYAWFDKNGLTDATSNFYSQYESYMIDFKDSTIYRPQLHQLVSDYNADRVEFTKDPKKITQLELLLTTEYFEYAPKAYSGIIKNPRDLEWFIPSQPKDYQLLLDTLVSTKHANDFIEPVNGYYVALKEKLREYRAIEQQGGWPHIAANPKKTIKVNDVDSNIVTIKKVLSITGDFTKDDTNPEFTESLSDAVKRFQTRTGLTVSGKIDPATLREMNVPVKARIKQMMVNMERLKWLPAQQEPDLILVNIPEFTMHVFENNKVTWSSKVVVGQTIHQTNIFKGSINNVVLNPYWVVPKSIIKNEILEKALRDPNYFNKNEMEVVSGNSVVSPGSVSLLSPNVSVRQKPGKNNSLGRYKFMSQNSFSIFLHDTPAKELFGQTNRAFSHGCIRLSEPGKLAKYLLRHDNSWTDKKIQQTIDSKKEVYIPLKYTLPVYIVYFTSWVDHTGMLNFRNDIYEWDKKLAAEIFRN